MLTMIFRMSAITLLFVVLTAVIFKWTKSHQPTKWQKIVIGVIYGLCAVLSTHFGINYNQMMLNVRDLGPLLAGLFFDPVAGILAGIIGGVERYIAGTYWGIGSYTRIACSVSTCLAGFVSAAIHILIFKRKKPSATYAFFMGAMMEVFHMYVIFITHRSDMSMAFYVVKICAVPMICFTGIGMTASSIILKLMSGEWRNPFRKLQEEEVTVTHHFQVWLFAVTFAILSFNQLLSFGIQTQTAIQNARNTLITVSQDINKTYSKLKETQKHADDLAIDSTRYEAEAVAEAIQLAGGYENIDEKFLEHMREIYNLESIVIVNSQGKILAGDEDTVVYEKLVTAVIIRKNESYAIRPDDHLAAAAARCGNNMVQLVMNRENLSSALNISGLTEAISYYHVGQNGTFDLISSNGVVTTGSHKGSRLSYRDKESMRYYPYNECFTGEMFGVMSLCRIEKLDKGLTLVAQLPMSEVYSNRDAQTYESVFAAIILFAVIYVLISMLVQHIIVNNLELVNASLTRITHGNLEEIVSVRNSSEFASLSNDINQTVTVLKGYIDAAEKRIEQELEFARTIQYSTLPATFIFPRDDFELFASMDTAKEVGGDFYDFFFIDREKLALVIADVSGKGIPAALFMMRAKTAIHGMAEQGMSPEEILYRANNTLCEGNEAEMFVTVWLGIIDMSTGIMQCANAGHEYPVLMRAVGDYEYFHDEHGFVLAGMEDMDFPQYEIVMKPGDRLFVYTDGVPEAINEQKEQYGAKRLLEVLNTTKTISMYDALPKVRESIADFVGNAEQFDDITMLGFTYRGSQKDGEEHDKTDI